MTANVANTANVWAYRTSNVKTSAVDVVAATANVANAKDETSYGVAASSSTYSNTYFFLQEAFLQKKIT